MYVIEDSVYAPLIIAYGGDLVEKLRKIKSVILDLTLYEACNVSWREHAELHKVSEEEAVTACKAAEALSRYITLCSLADLDAAEVMEVAAENGITFYDASYIALARKLKASIASEDRDILAVAPKYGVRVVRLSELANILEQA